MAERSSEQGKTPLTMRIEGAEAGLRIDRALVLRFPAYSRSYFQRLIAAGSVSVGAFASIKPSYRLKPDDIIKLQFIEPRPIDLCPQPVDFEIIAEEDDFIVVNKPAGLAVHPAPSAPGEITLVHGLLHRFAELAECEDSVRPGIIHRLDKWTSGLLVVARNASAKQALASLFEERRVLKCYKALVCGCPDADGMVDIAIGRHPFQRHKMSCNGLSMRPATTLFCVEKYYAAHALVDVRIITGRTHQIRVHMAWLGHPLLGDAVYGAPSKLLDRQALHAYRCSFEYRGREYSYQVELPLDMRLVLSRLEGGS